MDRMNDGSNNTGDKLDLLWAEYRNACPDPEPGADFMPRLWQKIESRRVETTSVFRRWAQACVMAAVALTLIMAVLIPRLQTDPVYTATYVDVLDAAHSNDAAELLTGGDIQ
jgi:hypothetical protein